MNQSILLVCLLAACASSPPLPSPPDPRLPQTERLASGLTVVIAPDVDGLGLFAMAAPDAEPLGLEGLTSLVVEFAMEGTQGERDIRPMARALALHSTLQGHYDGAILGWHIAMGSSTDILAATELLLDIAFEPTFPSTALSSRAERRRDLLLSDPESSRRAATQWAASLALGHGRPLGLTPSDLTLANVNRESLIRLHRRLLRPSRMALVVPSLPPDLRSRLDALIEPNDTPPPPAACRAPAGTRFVLASPSTPLALRAHRIPGPGMPGRRALDRLLERLSLMPLAPNFEVIDLAPESAIVYPVTDEGSEKTDLSNSLGAAKLSLTHYRAPATTYDISSVARDALFGATDDEPAPDLDDLPPPVEVDLAMPAPTAVVLPKDRPRCRP